MKTNYYRVTVKKSPKVLSVRVSRSIFERHVSPAHPARIGGIAARTAHEYMQLVSLLAFQHLFAADPRNQSWPHLPPNHRLARLGLVGGIEFRSELDDLTAAPNMGCVGGPGDLCAALGELEERSADLVDVQTIARMVRQLLGLPERAGPQISFNSQFTRSVYRIGSALMVELSEKAVGELYYQDQTRVAVFFNRYVAFCPEQWALLCTLTAVTGSLRKKTGSDFARPLGLASRDPAHHWYRRCPRSGGDLPPRMLTHTNGSFLVGYRRVDRLTPMQVGQLMSDLDQPHRLDATPLSRERFAALMESLRGRLAAFAAGRQNKRDAPDGASPPAAAKKKKSGRKKRKTSSK